MNIKSYPKKLQNTLKNRLAQIKKQKKDLREKDPFIQEAEQDGFRNLDETGDEAMELMEHQTIQAQKAELTAEEEEITQTLEDIKEGTYGVCESCGKKIGKERLKIYPTAKYCVECKTKKEKI